MNNNFAKPDLNPLMRGILGFLEWYGPASDEDLEAGVLLFLHGQPYYGGGWDEAIGSITETIVTMDLLRDQSVIGVGCLHNDNTYDHWPEACLNEEQEYLAWREALRGSGEVGETAYPLILSTAQWRWTGTYREDWNNGKVIQSRRDSWMDWSATIYQ